MECLADVQERLEPNHCKVVVQFCVSGARIGVRDTNSTASRRQVQGAYPGRPLPGLQVCRVALLALRRLPRHRMLLAVHFR